jgi:hypothetical protein
LVSNQQVSSKNSTSPITETESTGQMVQDSPVYSPHLRGVSGVGHIERSRRSTPQTLADTLSHALEQRGDFRSNPSQKSEPSFWPARGKNCLL